MDVVQKGAQINKSMGLRENEAIYDTLRFLVVVNIFCKQNVLFFEGGFHLCF